MTSLEHEQAGMTETEHEQRSREFEQRVAFVADAITPPKGQPRTKARFRRYAREAVEAMEAFERAREPSLLTRACRKLQTRAPFTEAELDELAREPSVREIEVSHHVPEGAVLKAIHMGTRETGFEDQPAPITTSTRIDWPPGG